MNVKEELEKTIARRDGMVNRLNQLKAQEQETLQEVLRLDGEVRAIERLLKDSNPSPE